MPFRKRVSLGFFCAAGCLLPISYVAAKPAGFKLRSGDALPPVQKELGTVLIQSGKHAAIDWDSFSIAEGEHIRFEQFNQKSYVLNRVLGSARSDLLGKLSSNGAIYLINPNGVFIGSQALIETAGFIASTLDLFEVKDSVLRFAGTSEEKIVNQGVIRCPAGDVFLIGRYVENSGMVEAARDGLISGFDVLIHPDLAPEVYIRAREEIDPELLQKNPYALAIQHSGQCRGREVYLVAEEGTSAVSGTIAAKDGGIVYVLGG